jgi:hypothetical protein
VVAWFTYQSRLNWPGCNIEVTSDRRAMFSGVVCDSKRCFCSNVEMKWKSGNIKEINVGVRIRYQRGCTNRTTPQTTA